MRARAILLLLIMLVSGKISAIMPNEPASDACIYVPSYLGVCAICGNSHNNRLTVSGCGKTETIVDGCLHHCFFRACTGTAPENDRIDSGCANGNQMAYDCIVANGQPWYRSALSTGSLSSAESPVLNYFKCTYPVVSFHQPDEVSAGTGICTSSHEKCKFAVFRASHNENGFNEEVACQDCIGLYFHSTRSSLYTHGNLTLSAHSPGCPEVLADRARDDVIDGDSSHTAKSALVYFLGVHRFLAGKDNKQEVGENLIYTEQSLYLTDKCKGVLIHSRYVMTSDHCGKLIQDFVLSESSPLMKVFRTEQAEGTGYITGHSIFRFSSEELGQSTGGLTVISLTASEEEASLSFPELIDQPNRLDRSLYLLESNAEGVSVRAGYLLFNARPVRIHRVNFMESRQQLWSGEPVFLQEADSLELIGWIDMALNDCGNNLNEGCIAPVTASTQTWVAQVFTQTLPNENLPVLHPDLPDCPTSLTPDPHDNPETPCPSLSDQQPDPVLLESIAPSAFVGGLAVGAITTALVTFCIVKLRGKSSQFEMQQMPD
jgi:hypothetical protein